MAACRSSRRALSRGGSVPRDNHPRERRARALKRKKGSKPPYDRVLIVCEGRKTEPLYFNDIRMQNRV